jgi:pyruvate dehydrogenase E2 component (dihydrolipoamide acetyltransferase)
MEKATIVQWLKQVGDQVTEGEAIIEITTDKVDVEVESPASGVLLKILTDAGEEVPVNEPVAIVGSIDEETSGIEGNIEESATAMEPKEDTRLKTQKPREEEKISSLQSEVLSLESYKGVGAESRRAMPKGRVFASPRARRLAREMGVNLPAVTGTGPRGRIVSQDVKNHVQDTKQTVTEIKHEAMPAAGQIIELSTIQRTVAERMTMSYRTAPHIDLLTDVNCEKMVALRALLKSQRLTVSYNDIITKYTSVVLREFPRFNAVFKNGNIYLIGEVNIGVAVAVGDELIVPVIRNVDRKDIKEIASESARLIAAARDKKLSLEDVSDGTLTITNLGMYGVRSFAAIINPPQVAILAVGVIEPRAVVVPGQIIAQQMTTLSLSIDHRVVNGAQGGEFLARLRELLETASLDILMEKGSRRNSTRIDTDTTD